MMMMLMIAAATTTKMAVSYGKKMGWKDVIGRVLLK